ncbi:MAG: hypothetical protein HGB01_01895 [Chlorobiaceae bacterium]|nr:hypothetical protein [Chlorobiaceae bacterium]
MPNNNFLQIKDIKLDLNNYRTIPQKTEEDAINAMIAIKPDRFYAVIESIIDDGYLPTENLIILSDDGYTVKEGNRRAAALKLIHGIYPVDNFNIPDNVKNRINSLDKNWKDENLRVPCSVYSIGEKSIVDKIVNLTHAKGEKASRDPWTSVAKARQNRNEKKGSEPALDLLEKYIQNGNNLTVQQKERWSGDYPITVLDEALRAIVTRMGYGSISELVKAYPGIIRRTDLEDILRDIGLQVFGFKEIRDASTDFAADYNIPVLSSATTGTTSTSIGGSVTASTCNNPAVQNSNTSNNGVQGTAPAQGSITSGSTGQTVSQSTQKPKAYAIHDQKYVTQTLKNFIPKGNNRQKIVTLRDELRKLKVINNPIAFCFILRSMFEISANIYSDENDISKKQANGKADNNLRQQLNAVTLFLTSNNANTGMVKVLHGANSELSKATGLLSVTSMNQLVHNPTFSIAPHDIFALFNNVYPLLEAMN